MDTAARNQEIKYMEEISLNAWPSYRIELYDGWLLRYSHNYSFRTNSVEQIGPGTTCWPRASAASIAARSS